MPKMGNYVRCQMPHRNSETLIVSYFTNEIIWQLEFPFSYRKITIPKLIHIILFNFFLVPFQIIKFPNDPCDVSSTKNGTCYTS